MSILAGIGIPVACFLHGYAGFIFGSVKANALWMTPLMPVIFIMSAIVSGIALCIWSTLSSWKCASTMRSQEKQPPSLGFQDEEHIRGVEAVVRMTTKSLLYFMIAAISLELLDLIFRGYTAVKSWDILRQVIYQRDFYQHIRPSVRHRQPDPVHPSALPGITVRRTFFISILACSGCS